MIKLLRMFRMKRGCECVLRSRFLQQIYISLLTLIFLFLAALSGSAQMAQKRAPVRSAQPGKLHLYYMAADEVRWDYAPKGRHLTGVPSPESEETEGPTPSHPPPKIFLKAIYREYTDDTFKTLKLRTPEWEHLGILGPLIRAEVGDTIKVFFVNRTKIFCSLHPHGLAYAKDSEGAFYDDGTSGADREDDLIAPGKSHTYTWTVPERAGPAPGDSSSVLWMYHSHFVEPRDLNTGLLGPIIVTRRGSTKADGTPKDVDREFVAALAVFDETASIYFDSNTGAHVNRPLDLKFTDPGFRKPYLMYSINGLIEGNLPMLTMKKGERVRWYLLSNSNEDDVHSAHWHGQTVVSNGMRSDTVPLGPMAMSVADMVPDNVGIWLFHCHVNDHYEGGMQALFKVIP
jgi:FtsP/CotA-like multicopper oxidase with cupredoxin domain